jgi:hypothetical protein
MAGMFCFQKEKQSQVYYKMASVCEGVGYTRGFSAFPSQISGAHPKLFSYLRNTSKI